MHRSTRLLQRSFRNATGPAALWLAVYAGVLAAAPLDDARAESRAAANRAVHVESAGAPACPPVHDHAACQVCRTLRTASSPPPPLRLSSPLTAAVRGAPRESVARYTPTFSGPFRPRAPPQG